MELWCRYGLMVLTWTHGKPKTPPFGCRGDFWSKGLFLILACKDTIFKNKDASVFFQKSNFRDFFWYWCLYLHRSRDSVYPVCGIFTFFSYLSWVSSSCWLVSKYCPSFCNICFQQHCLTDTWPQTTPSFVPLLAMGFIIPLSPHPWHTHDTPMTPMTPMTHPWHPWHTHDTPMTHPWHPHDTHDTALHCCVVI